MRKISYSSILVGLLTFGLLGVSIYGGLIRLDLLQESNLYYVFLGVGVLIGAYLGYIKPIGTEAISFAITGLVMVQAGWDIMKDIQNPADPRVITLVVAIGIFILNTFTGKFRRGTAKKTIRRFLGLR